MENLAEQHFNQFDISNMTQTELFDVLNSLADKVRSRRETCRKSSSKYYNKTFKLADEPTKEQVAKNREAIEKRDAYQANYYKKNAEKIKARQKAYREKIKKKRELEDKKE